MAAISDGENKGKLLYPYLPYKTLESVLAGLEHGIPHQLDRSLWTSQSGSTQATILQTLRFFGLIDNNDAPTTDLRDLVTKKNERQALWSKLVSRSYPELIAIGLEHATLKQVSDFFYEAGLSGSTHRKALALFLKLAQEGQISLSPYLKRKMRKGPAPSSGKPRTAQRRAAKGSEPPAATIIQTQSGSGFSRTIQLRTGGTLSLSVSIDPFDMDEDDRKFVFEMIDKMKTYQSENDVDTD